jgi:urease alpha subunit
MYEALRTTVVLMLAGGTKPTDEASAYTVVEIHTFIALQMFLSTENVARSIIN